MWLRTGNVLLVGLSGGEAPGGLERGITQEAMAFVDATMCWNQRPLALTDFSLGVV